MGNQNVLIMMIIAMDASQNVLTAVMEVCIYVISQQKKKSKKGAKLTPSLDVPKIVYVKYS